MAKKKTARKPRKAPHAKMHGVGPAARKAPKRRAAKRAKRPAAAKRARRAAVASDLKAVRADIQKLAKDIAHHPKAPKLRKAPKRRKAATVHGFPAHVLLAGRRKMVNAHAPARKGHPCKHCGEIHDLARHWSHAVGEHPGGHSFQKARNIGGRVLDIPEKAGRAWAEEQKAKEARDWAAGLAKRGKRKG